MPCIAKSANVFYFNPPAPRGAGRQLHILSSKPFQISIHPLLAERDDTLPALSDSWIRISIHPLLAERDNGGIQNFTAEDVISIHPLLAERDFQCSQTRRLGTKFQSTRSSRSGTDPAVRLPLLGNHFNPPAPRGAGHEVFRLPEHELPISIHPLLAERDRPPHGVRQAHGRISIHPLLAERDARGRSLPHPPGHFNPPAPRGAGR